MPFQRTGRSRAALRCHYDRLANIQNALMYGLRPQESKIRPPYHSSTPTVAHMSIFTVVANLLNERTVLQTITTSWVGLQDGVPQDRRKYWVIGSRTCVPELRQTYTAVCFHSLPLCSRLLVLSRKLAGTARGRDRRYCCLDCCCSVVQPVAVSVPADNVLSFPMVCPPSLQFLSQVPTRKRFYESKPDYI